MLYKAPPFVKGRGQRGGNVNMGYSTRKGASFWKHPFLWRRRESTAEGEAEIPLRKTQLFRQPHISVSTATAKWQQTSKCSLFFLRGVGGVYSKTTHNKKTTGKDSVVSCQKLQRVEAAGVEPASKLGTQKLSTRLFCV